MLALTGSKDIQVNPLDAERICGLVAGPCRHGIVPGLSHLLRTELGEPSVRTYRRQAKRPVDRQLLDQVASWSLTPSGSVGCTPVT